MIADVAMAMLESDMIFNDPSENIVLMDIVNESFAESSMQDGTEEIDDELFEIVDKGE